MPKMYKHTCEYCNNEYEITQARENRIASGKVKHCFCCKKCYDSYQRKNEILCNCEICGKTIYRTQSAYAKSINHFCSNKCADEFRHLQITEERVCPICQKTFRAGLNTTKIYCSIQCQGKWQSTQIGKINPRYRRIESNCTYCNKTIDVQRYQFNNGQLKFCDENCRRKWYAEIFSQSDEWKQSSRDRILKELENGVISTVNSKPQQMIDFLLDSMRVDYHREMNIKYFSVDNYIVKYNLFIEVQGDYWHCNPNKFKKISKTQWNRITKDKAKHTYISNKYHSNVLYLWESDIYNSMELCEMLINHFIDNNGIIENYNSFNYHMYNSELRLNKNIICSYQERNIEEYRNLINAS